MRSKIARYEHVKVGNEEWEVLPPQRAGGHYEKYRNEKKIIVVRSDNDKYIRVYLSDPLAIAIAEGKKAIPEWVEVLVRGHRLGIRAAVISGKGNGGYRMTNKSTNSKGSVETGLYFVNLSAWVKRFDIKSGAYDAEIQGNLIHFDFKDKPASV